MHYVSKTGTLQIKKLAKTGWSKSYSFFPFASFPSFDITAFFFLFGRVFP